MQGILYICATPIGNLEDVTIRLLKTLRAVDLVACEDTRQTVKLLNKYKIKKKLVSYHEHNKKGKEHYIINELINGKNIAVVSDAGMPAISDPGEELVKRAIEENINIEIIPGPSAVIAALAISGVDTSKFIFEGFLPERQGKRQTELRRIEPETRTSILYEAPHRLLATLEDIKEIMGEERWVVVARELTKKYEETKRGTVIDLINHFKTNPAKGEICIIISGKKEKTKKADMTQIIEEVETLIKNGENKKEAFKIKAREYNMKKSEIYNFFEKNKS
ncbi:16S rRNA (cytidine(1402)-2'-O)-methyltransferase [Candidatus Syntrophocurvum alkaliphilum]|uniref:Ribosomal RNA small subunit methyltransferase I n=1 Tax=Candidatus Syntrophocurvum alkaliphilum TaxID=2293317 RepID=A0A6I6DNS5_9FIRM|nr:16S rRNA (cytidine(1402)-2'-O)-methyltransferase [Candidatus Syntrophocurvum alkaliphilum]QGU00578.1 16S rRNA (cytidine(1402)-2'-O)-methyltransferase [Candidatus Syntrophocurvum alkaliphilum]